MSTASIIFIVPEDFSAISDLVDERGGIFEDWDPDSGEDLAGFLSAKVGSMASVIFEDTDDPIDDVLEVVGALKGAQAPYFAVTDSYEERSRGERIEATVTLSLDGKTERRVFYPWKLGEPELNERTLKNAGFSDDEANAMGDLFFPGSPALRY